METVNFLDVIFNLNDGTYQPYQKPDNITQYIHVKSHHSPDIIKQIFKTIENGLSQLSSNEQIFDESAPFCKNKLQQSWYQKKLKYNLVNTKIHNKCKHKKNII